MWYRWTTVELPDGTEMRCMCPNMPSKCRWWKRKINCWRATCSPEHFSYQAHPGWYCNAQQRIHETSGRDSIICLALLSCAEQLTYMTFRKMFIFLWYPLRLHSFLLYQAFLPLLVGNVWNSQSSSTIVSPVIFLISVYLVSPGWMYNCSSPFTIDDWKYLCCTKFRYINLFSHPKWWQERRRCRPSCWYQNLCMDKTSETVWCVEMKAAEGLWTQQRGISKQDR